MIDIRDHGGSFGGSKFKKGSEIPTWFLEPITLPVISQRFTAWAFNDYIPVIDYHEDNERYYVGAGRIVSISNGFGNVATLNLSDRTFSDILVFKEKVFAIAGYLYQFPLDLTSYSQSGTSQTSMNGLIGMGDYLYSFSNNNKTVYTFDPSKTLVTVVNSTALKDAAVPHYFFKKTLSNYFFGTQDGRVVKYDLNGNLLDAITLSASLFRSMDLIGEHLYVAVNNILYKININTFTIIWTVTISAVGGYITSIKGEKDYLYLTHYNNDFMVLNANDGSLVFDPEIPVSYSGGTTKAFVRSVFKENFIHAITAIRNTGYDLEYNLIRIPVKQTLLKG